MKADLLDRIPDDVAALLSRTPALQGVPCFGPAEEMGGASIEERIEATLSRAGLQESDGAIGLCLWVQDIEGDNAMPETPCLVMSARLRVIALENPMLNSHGLTAYIAALRAASALHLWSPNGTTTLTPSKSNFISRLSIVDDVTGQPKADWRAWAVEFRLHNVGVTAPPRAPAPRASQNGDTELFSFHLPDDVEAEVWFTIDAQGGAPALPAPGEPSATKYTQPFAAPVGATLRAASYAPGLLPSHVLMFTVEPNN